MIEYRLARYSEIQLGRFEVVELRVARSMIVDPRVDQALPFDRSESFCLSKIDEWEWQVKTKLADEISRRVLGLGRVVPDDDPFIYSDLGKGRFLASAARALSALTCSR